MREPAPSLDSLPWRSEHDLRYSDVDRQGHVNNGVFDRLMESSRVLMVDTCLGGERGALRFALARMEIDYFGEMFWPGKVVATAGFERLGAMSITVRQALFCKGVCVAAGRAIVVHVDGDSHRPAPLPSDLTANAKAWMARRG